MIEKFLNEEFDENYLFELMIYGIIDKLYEFQLCETIMKKKFQKKQYESLLKLSTYLVKKYDIDLSKKTTFHRECLWVDCDSPLISEKFYPIIGHRDAWHTSCPWDELYEEIEKKL